jgi:hypothetical protein
MSRLVVLRMVLAFVVLAAAGGGCVRHAPQVMGIPNRNAAALTAEDIIQIMRPAGFTDEQILAFGPDLRNLLASTGAAQIRVGDKIEAMYAVDDQRVLISSRRNGTFSYPLRPESVAVPLDP